MKKLMTTVSAVALALGLYATDTGTSFEGLSAGAYDITATTGELSAQEAGTSYWVTNGTETLTVVAGTSTDVNSERPDKYKNAAQQKYLSIKTTLGNPVTRNVSVGGAGTAIGSGFYFDSLVKFTAFDGDPQNVHLPVNYSENAVVYTGTHDNDTTAGWYAGLPEETQKMVSLYIRTHHGVRNSEHAPVFGAGAACEHLVEAAQQSKAAVCVIPMQDYLRLGSEHRINIPGTSEGNWGWRLTPGSCTEELAQHVRDVTVRNGRGGKR